jgi:A/G-specific adenine glycosylase
MDIRYFSEKVVEWYEEHKRDLPWRNTVDPYKIWISEIILQQTRVNQGLPYYLRFLEKFPDVLSLASASEDEILRLWQGLGYYSRARNLHKCAKRVVSHHDGNFPGSYQILITLPGIGDYTAAAIASFSSREKVAVLDGNVFRVLSRIHGESLPINSVEGKKVFSTLAKELMGKAAAADIHNQAIMEFGALWCTPKQPRCEDCFFRKKCFAAANTMQDVLPVKLKQRKARKRYFNYFVVKKGESILMKKRLGKDIWNGLYDFYLIETSRSTKADTLISTDPFLDSMAQGISVVSEEYKHVLSHQTIISKFIVLEGNANRVKEEALEYYSLKKISDLPKPVLINRFLEDYNFL